MSAIQYNARRKAVEDYKKLQRKMETFPKPEIDEDDLRQWQMDLYEYVKGEPHTRNIKWVYDSVGGRGKSTFIRFLAWKLGKDAVFIFSDGKAADIKYAY